MEAMWTRYLPQTSIINQLVADGTLGDIHLVTADHGQHIPEGHRVRSLDSGGGALLDLGIYPIAFASQILGAPSAVHNVGSLVESGVDAQSLLTLSYKGAAQAQLNTTLLARTPITASVAGTDALLPVGNGFFTPTSLTLSKPGFNGESIHWKDETGVVGHRGLSYQATALAGFVAQGLTSRRCTRLTKPSPSSTRLIRLAGNSVTASAPNSKAMGAADAAPANHVSQTAITLLELDVYACSPSSSDPTRSEIS